MQQGNCINVFLARHVSGTYAHHQEHQMLSCSIWFSAPSAWMGGGLESCCVGCVCGADVAVRRTTYTTYAAALKTTTHPKTRCRKPYAATLQLMGIHVCTWNMSSWEDINKITLLHQVGISNCINHIHLSGVLRNFVWVGGSTNSVEDRENGDLGAVAP